MDNADDDEWEVELDPALDMPKGASGGGSAFWDELHFPSKRGEVSKYLCISTEKMKEGNDPDYKWMGTLVAPALFKTLKMPSPSLVITVTGFARSVTEDELPYKQRVDISKAVVKVARTTQTCFITGGVAGHAKMVGEALMEAEIAAETHKTVCLGIAPYGKIIDHEKMKTKAEKNMKVRKRIAKKQREQRDAESNGKSYDDDGDNGEEKKPFVYHGHDALENGRSEMVAGTTIRKLVALEPNHTHFVLVDDGTKSFPTDDGQMKNAIEENICQREFEDIAPIVQLVINGGIGAVSAILGALERSHPVVVCAESGGACTCVWEFCKALFQQEAHQAGYGQWPVAELLKPDTECRPARRKVYRMLLEMAPSMRVNDMEGTIEKWLIQLEGEVSKPESTKDGGGGGGKEINEKDRKDLEQLREFLVENPKKEGKKKKLICDELKAYIQACLDLLIEAGRTPSDKSKDELEMTLTADLAEGDKEKVEPRYDGDKELWRACRNKMMEAWDNPEALNDDEEDKKLIVGRRKPGQVASLAFFYKDPNTENANFEESEKVFDEEASDRKREACNRLIVKLFMKLEKKHFAKKWKELIKISGYLSVKPDSLGGDDAAGVGVGSDNNGAGNSGDGGGDSEATDKFQLSFYIYSRVQAGEALFDLKDHIFNAVLSDCAENDERLRHAVRWGLDDVVCKLLQAATDAKTAEEDQGSFWGQQRRLLLGSQNYKKEDNEDDAAAKKKRDAGQDFQTIENEKNRTRGYTLGMALFGAARSRREGDDSSSDRSLSVVAHLLDFRTQATYVVFDKLFQARFNRFQVKGFDYKMTNSQKRATDRNIIEGKVSFLKGKQIVADLARSDEKERDGQVGFKTLCRYLDKVGYKHNLDARKLSAAGSLGESSTSGGGAYPSSTSLDDGKAEVEMEDLMMWAVLIGNIKLARLLWEKTNHPLRAALNAARLCQTIMDLPDVKESVHERERLEEDCMEYERWCVGLLDHMQDMGEAIGPLTTVFDIPSVRRRRDGSLQTMWPRSVLDEAIKYPPLPGKSPFVLHRHSRQVVDEYWHGRFPSSRYYIDQRNSKELAVQFHILTAGLLLHPKLAFLLPPFLRLPFQTNSSRQRRGAGDDQDSNVVKNPSIWEFLRIWVAFWSLPKVRYMAHAYSYIVFVVCLCVTLFTWHSERVRLPYSLLTPNAHFTAHIAFEEWVVWVLGFSRLLDEATEIGGAYSKEENLQTLLMNHYGFGLKALWNLCDVVMLSLLVPSAFLRAFTRVQWATGNTTWTVEELSEFLHVINSLLSAMAIVATFRFLEWLSYYFKSVGELVTIIARMIVVLAPMALIILVISIGYGAAFTALLANGDLPSVEQSPYLLDHPFFMPWWALLGAFDVSAINERLELDRAVLPAMLMWSYVFFSTVLLLNLLIAQATTAFDKVRSQSEVERRILFAQLVQQYKDRAGLPPPFNLLEIAAKLLAKIVPYVEQKLNELASTTTGDEGYMEIKKQATSGSTLTRKYLKRYTQLCHMQEEAARGSSKVDELKRETMSRFDRLATQIADINDRLIKEFTKAKTSQENKARGDDGGARITYRSTHGGGGGEVEAAARAATASAASSMPPTPHRSKSIAPPSSDAGSETPAIAMEAAAAVGSGAAPPGTPAACTPQAQKGKPPPLSASQFAAASQPSRAPALASPRSQAKRHFQREPNLAARGEADAGLRSSGLPSPVESNDAGVPQTTAPRMGGAGVAVQTFQL